MEILEIIFKPVRVKLGDGVYGYAVGMENLSEYMSMHGISNNSDIVNTFEEIIPIRVLMDIMPELTHNMYEKIETETLGVYDIIRLHRDNEMKIHSVVCKREKSILKFIDFLNENWYETTQKMAN